MATEPRDDELIAAVARRDSAALVALYDRYGRLAFALAYRILGDPGLAEETVQDAFLLVWRRAHGFDPGRGSGVRPWLPTIVHHRAIDALRRARRAGDATPLADVEGRLAAPAPWDEGVGGWTGTGSAPPSPRCRRSPSRPTAAPGATGSTRG